MFVHEESFSDQVPEVQGPECLDSHEDDVRMDGMDLFCLSFALRHSNRGLGTNE